MAGNRRDFIKASVAASVLGGSSASAKTSQKKTGSHPRTPPTVAIVHSTIVEKNKVQFERAFFEGLKANHWNQSQIKFLRYREQKGSYASLQTAAQAAVDDRPNLIVAAGGLVAGIAVAQALKARSSGIPFVFIVGRLPQQGDTPANPGGDDFRTSTNRAGGVDLNTVGQNENRYAALHGKDTATINPGNVALIVNDNAAMAAQEVIAWNNNGHPQVVRLFSGNAPNNNDEFETRLDNEIKKLSPSPKGIVVSSDPMFRYYRSGFDDALRKTFHGWVCYPFAEFNAEAHDPANTTFVGPELAPAAGDTTYDNSGYYQLGLKVAAVLTAQVAHTALPKAVAQWNGTKWPDIVY
jgi:hypothetical protein